MLGLGVSKAREKFKLRAMKTIVLSVVLAGVSLLATHASAAPAGKPGDAPKTITTKSGHQICDLKVGDGAEAVKNKSVLVTYKGTLQNGQVFDQSYGRGPFSFKLGAGQVIAGWDEGVAGMKVGGKRKLVIPPNLAYGDQGVDGVIAPGATLIFEVELLDVN